jgi:ribosomal protein L11 methyltransferase
MDHDHRAVAGQLAVELDHVSAELDRTQERGPGVLGAMARSPPVRNPQHAFSLRHGRRLTEIAVESESSLWHTFLVDRWIEVSVTIPPDAADAVSHRLIEIGAPGTIEEEAAERRRIRAHFRAPADSQSLGRELRAFLVDLEADFPGCARAPIEIASIDEEDWAEAWKQGFPPLEIGRNLRVRPPWAARSSGRLDIEIHPAMAFGTGQHASTAGCLEALERLFAQEGVLSPVLDVGTGSGILAIAAARLGSRRVLGLDVDSVAVEAAAENVRRNHLTDAIRIRQGTVDDVEDESALVMANLYSGLLTALFPKLATLTLPGGWMIASGLLDLDRSEISLAAARSGWQPEDERSIDGWVTLTLRRARAAMA